MRMNCPVASSGLGSVGAKKRRRGRRVMVGAEWTYWSSMMAHGITGEATAIILAQEITYRNSEVASLPSDRSSDRRKWLSPGFQGTCQLVSTFVAQVKGSIPARLVAYHLTINHLPLILSAGPQSR